MTSAASLTCPLIYPAFQALFEALMALPVPIPLTLHCFVKFSLLQLRSPERQCLQSYRVVHSHDEQQQSQ